MTVLPARLSIVTLGARDMGALRSFYRTLGWPQLPGGDDTWMSGYLQFHMIAPVVSKTFGGHRSTHDVEGRYHYTPENYEACEHFVVDSALRLGRSDFALWMPRTYGDMERAEQAMAANGGRLPDDMEAGDTP